jgi:hypothetical protein
MRFSATRIKHRAESMARRIRDECDPVSPVAGNTEGIARQSLIGTECDARPLPDRCHHERAGPDESHLARPLLDTPEADPTDTAHGP